MVIALQRSAKVQCLLIDTTHGMHNKLLHSVQSPILRGFLSTERLAKWLMLAAVRMLR